MPRKSTTVPPSTLPNKGAASITIASSENVNFKEPLDRSWPFTITLKSTTLDSGDEGDTHDISDGVAIVTGTCTEPNTQDAVNNSARLRKPSPRTVTTDPPARLPRDGTIESTTGADTYSNDTDSELKPEPVPEATTRDTTPEACAGARQCTSLLLTNAAATDSVSNTQ